MKPIKISHLFFLLFFLPILGCPDPDKSQPDSSITIINKNGKSILYVKLQRSDKDTTIPFKDSPFSNTFEYNSSLIRANSQKKVSDRFLDGFDMGFNYLTIFLFSQDTIDHVSWEKIRSEYNILKRYDLSKSKLDSLNWTIEYK